MSHSRNQRRRARRSPVRRIRVFSEIDRELQPEHIARIITAAGLEQARLEAAAQSEDEARQSAADSSSPQEDEHA